jgi:hypothetical protein
LRKSAIFFIEQRKALQTPGVYAPSRYAGGVSLPAQHKNRRRFLMKKRNGKGAPAAVLALALVSWLAMTGCPADDPGGGETDGSTDGQTGGSTSQIGGTGPAGGLIFYVSVDGFSSGGVTCHYLEAAPADLESQYQWGGTGTSCSTGTAIGTGAANTADLVTHDHSDTPHLYSSDFHLAARACADYSYGGYSDWFLPSKDELAQMYTNLGAKEVGDFVSSYYWSSSESGEYRASYQRFFSIYSYSDFLKYQELFVRPARAF